MSEVKYSKEHEWIKLEGDVATIGITKHATEMLGDIVFAELPEKGSNVEKDGTAGVVESTKAASDVYTPVSGEVVDTNQEIVDDPSKINQDPENSAWFLSTTSPPTGVYTSLAAFVDSTTPAVPSFSTLEPFSGSSAKTISPNISVACLVMPIVATSPSNFIHSCSFEYFTSLINLLL